MIVSAVHHADVLPRGKRREERRSYRLDVPVEFVRAVRRDLETVIEVEFPLSGPKPERLAIPGFGGRLWRPHLTQAAAVGHTYEAGLPTAFAERHAMREAELDLWKGGEAQVAYRSVRHDDPIERTRGVYAEGRDLIRWTGAKDLPRIEDDDVKEVLWSDAPAVERRLREAADRILIVDGRVWTQMEEPVLELRLAPGGRSIGLRARVSPMESADHHSLRQFRLDRLDEMRDWAGRQGLSAVRSPGKGLKGLTVEGTVVKAVGLVRDDARFVLASRLTRVTWEGAELVPLLPAEAVDAFVELKRFRGAVAECTTPTAELYARLETLAAAVETLSGLSDAEFAAREKTREAISPALTRWRSHEAVHHAAREAAPEAPAP